MSKIPGRKVSPPGPPEDDRDEFVRALVAGEESAWQRFFRDQGGLILSAGRKVGLDESEREDLFQNTCIICYRSIQSLRDSSRLAGWIYRIAYRQALELVGKRRPDSSLETDDGRSRLDQVAMSDAGPTEEDHLVQFEISLQLRDSLEQVGDPCRSLLTVLYLDPDSQSYEDVSRRLKMPIGSIGPTRARCLDRLRRKLNAVSEEGKLGTYPRKGDDSHGPETERKTR